MIAHLRPREPYSIAIYPWMVATLTSQGLTESLVRTGEVSRDKNYLARRPTPSLG